jgi:type I restriction enzyme, S subunit
MIKPFSLLARRPYGLLDSRYEIPVPRSEEMFALADQIEAQFHAAMSQVAKLTPSLLARAFTGRLLPQDLWVERVEKLLQRTKPRNA